MLAGSAVTVAAMLASWLALVSLGGLRVAGFAIPPTMELACGIVAEPIALAVAFRTVFSMFRGPPVISFERRDAAHCWAAEATAVRASAQLCGTMGGAGHVYPSRLVFPTAAWVGAALCGAEAVSARAAAMAGLWPFAFSVSAVVVAFVFPSRPFWYREVTGGGVVVTPPEAAALLTARRIDAVDEKSRRARGGAR